MYMQTINTGSGAFMASYISRWVASQGLDACVHA